MNTHIVIQKCMAAFVLALAVVLFMPSCTPSPLGRLGGIDSLINTRPDSAMALLNTLLPDTNSMGKRDLMRFHLLRTNAQNKCDTVFTARHAALMRRVCDYYDHHDHHSSKREANNCMLAHYLLGRCYDDMGEAPAALQEFNQSIDFADTTSIDCNHHLLSLVHSQKSGIYSKLYMPNDELRELQEAAHFARLDDDSLSYWFYQELSANCYLHLHKPDSFLLQKEKCADAFRKMGYKNYAAIALGTAALTLIEQGELEKAKTYLHEYEANSGLFNSDGTIASGRETYYYCKGLYYLYVGKTDSAEFCFRKELNTGKTNNDQICASQGLCKLYQQLHRSDSVAKYAIRSYVLSDSTYEESVGRSLHEIQAMHDYSRYQAKALEQSKRAYVANKRNTVFCSVIVVLSVVIVLIIRRHQRKVRHKEVEMNRILLEYAKDKEAIGRKKEELQQLLNAEKEIRTELENSNQALHDIIQGKISEIAELNNKLDEYKAHTQFNPFDESGIVAITKTDVYSVFDSYTKYRKIKPTEEDWQRLQGLIESYYPSFRTLLKVRNRINSYDYRVCMLVMLRLTPGDMASIMEKELPSISKTRKKLLKNVFHMDGKPEDFDRILRESI